MRKFALTLALSVTSCLAYGQNCKNGQCRPVQKAATATAQGVASMMARMGRIGHFGGNPYSYEGTGMGSTPEQALNSCCYSRSGLRVADQGVAQGKNGKFYACKRYVR